MTTTRGAKAKAVRHQNRVRDDLRAQYPDWTRDDIRCAIMGQAGCDIILSARARKDFGFSVECKATARGWTPAYDALAQAAANDEHETIPLAVVKQDRREPQAILRWSDFLAIIKAGA